MDAFLKFAHLAGCQSKEGHWKLTGNDDRHLLLQWKYEPLHCRLGESECCSGWNQPPLHRPHSGCPYSASHSSSSLYLEKKAC